MAAKYSYTSLDQASEDALHASRLLQVEERPFHRVTRSLLGKDSLLKWTPPQQLPSPPPDGEEEAQPAPDTEEDAQKRQKFREEILLDFAALESSILRIQLLLASNKRERERYATEKAKILDTAQSVRDNTLHLRSQLVEAQDLLKLRKGYDELATKLIDPKKNLKTRAETREEIGKLEKEIEDLEQESADFEGVWAGRKDAFERVVGEGQAMVRLIKGIKDEPEVEKEDEHMAEAEEGEKGERSRMGTPAPEGSTPMPVAASGGETPLRPEGELGEGGATPRPTNKFLEVEDATRVSSRAESPAVQPDADIEMGEDTAELEPEVKTTGGMEATEEQVKTMEERVEPDEEDIEATGEQVGTPAEGQVATPAQDVSEVMDES